jgi:hypothetical protein
MTLHERVGQQGIYLASAYFIADMMTGVLSVADREETPAPAA